MQYEHNMTNRQYRYNIFIIAEVLNENPGSDSTDIIPNA